MNARCEPLSAVSARYIGRVVRPLPVASFLSAGLPIVDVRSPGEHARGHIPGAHSMPLFSNEERAVVGTLYKQAGRDAAVLEGLRIVGPRLAVLVEQARAVAPDGRIGVHCWRGGERSGSVAWLLDKAGFAQVITLQHGYKAFRQHVLAQLERPVELRVLGGYTGSGKTETLGQLRALGAQVIDLEALAHHKGSSFGALGEPPQPSTEHFENRLWQALSQLDPDRPCWVEDESRTIGRVALPVTFFEHMQRAPMVFALMPVEERVQRLVADYGGFPREELAESIRRIARRVGPQHARHALEALEADDLPEVARTVLRYYDRAYLHACGRRTGPMSEVPAAANDLRALAQRIMSDGERPDTRATGAAHAV